MRMEKPLYAIDLTKSKDNTATDTTPLHTAQISEALRQQQRAADAELTRRIRRAYGIRLFIGALLLAAIGAAVLCLFVDMVMESLFTEETAQIVAQFWWLSAAGLGLMLVGAVLYVLSRRRRGEMEGDPAYKEAADRADRLHQAVEAELGLPPESHMTQVDLLPFRYRTSGRRIKEMREEGIYENVYAYLWRSGDTLCITDSDAVITVPLSSVDSFVMVDEVCSIRYWRKEEDPEASRWVECAEDEDSGRFYRVRGIGEMRIRYEDEIYLLRVPGYEFDVVQRMLEL